ncbi:MAG: GNAT family N-acetyltransferase [Pseudomonadota bacterium]
MRSDTAKPRAEPAEERAADGAATWRLRPATAADAAAVAALLREAFAAYDGRLQPRPGALSETEASIAAALEAGAGAVAEAEGAIVGCVLWRPQEDGLYLGRLGVRPGWRSRGIARALVETVIAAGRQAGVKRVTLNVRIALPDNIALFERVGFLRGEARAHPGFDHPTYYVMERRLDRAPG